MPADQISLVRPDSEQNSLAVHDRNLAALRQHRTGHRLRQLAQVQADKSHRGDLPLPVHHWHGKRHDRLSGGPPHEIATGHKAAAGHCLPEKVAVPGIGNGAVDDALATEMAVKPDDAQVSVDRKLLPQGFEIAVAV